jgi:hypothetical protein
MRNFKEKYLQDKYVFIFLGAAIIAVGTFGFRDHLYKSGQVEDAVDTFEDTMPAQCENGDWIEFPDMADANQYEKFLGKEKLSYDEANGTFTSEDGTKKFMTDEQYSLFFFVDRNVQIDGYKLKNGEIYAKKVKCIGAESDKNALYTRRKLMNYIKDNINSVAPEKAPHDVWQVENFYFVNDTDLYVEYETEGSFMEEAPYDAHLWLIRVSAWSGDVPVIQTVAYIQEDPDDFDKNIVKQGEDIYKDTKNMTIYEFDDETNQWALQ